MSVRFVDLLYSVGGLQEKSSSRAKSLVWEWIPNVPNIFLLRIWLEVKRDKKY